MDILIWIGAAISLAGLAGIIACIVMTARARGAGLDDAALRARLKQMVTYNLAALMVSAIGLMCVVVGIMLG
ncbi:hypothetical protein DKT77_06325 [Meridianimarinicoccus roseus]|uniref:Uncharacterized protein n=1 Tax=Meridianimarinicoccus roseus TaxID=2072018 RepID=A0A2V2LHJ0_9RHOB|nr:hypothetical protein [Meridianimarinicoccus roseus]PWR03471.1 hypothetical protein DKT77_06325 [Meridianimarinicoccus roseus]